MPPVRPRVFQNGLAPILAKVQKHLRKLFYRMRERISLGTPRTVAFSGGAHSLFCSAGQKARNYKLNLSWRGLMWRDIPGFIGAYQVSTGGKVRSLARKIVKRSGHVCGLRGRVLRPHKSHSGYLYVCVGARKFSVHYLVLSTFKGPALGRTANHLNGDKLDNSVTNLEWVSHRGNVMHSRNILGTRGKFLSVRDCVDIIKLSHQGARVCDIAKTYNVRRQAISGILTGYRWPCEDYPAIRDARKKFPPRLRHKRFRTY